MDGLFVCVQYECVELLLSLKEVAPGTLHIWSTCVCPKSHGWLMQAQVDHTSDLCTKVYSRSPGRTTNKVTDFDISNTVRLLILM